MVSALQEWARGQVLAEADWRVQAGRHERRVDRYVGPHLARRRDRVKHPAHDFLFTYYSHRPAQLRRWHPGFGVALENAGERAAWKGYEVVAADGVECPDGSHDDHFSTRLALVTHAYLLAQRPLIESTLTLLTATAGRAPNFGCFGLHEWAMVHRLPEGGTRHPDWPLRLGPAGTDAVLESHRVACSHFDAYRFFTPSARPLNTLDPGPDDRPAYEQPACLHANMDLYKHAFRLSPLVPSHLVLDCFELARDIRVVDMRASPYDLADLGLPAIPIETAEGKQQYAAAQRRFADRARRLRTRLAIECERLLVAGRD